MHSYFLLIVLLPLSGFLINLFLGKRIKSESFSGWFSTFMVLIPFLISILSFIEILHLPEENKKIILNYFSWITAGSLQIEYSFLIDPLSVIMMLVITGVGLLIHIYSIGYMHNDEEFAKFFAYMNLFIFAMLHLVLAKNFLLVFLGWEGVGLCSYLLIGFWYQKKFTGDAAKKAFVVNRIGDFGFMIAMLLIFTNFETLDIPTFLGSIAGYTPDNSLLIIIAVLLLLGATGKSAQIPLYVWLPDAMAGPTPVSALIHAATMVTGGVYLIARTSLLYSMAPYVGHIILIVGIATAILSATIALKQNDIKKVLAYSTVSQLGFMFIALGTHSYVAAIFHLVTHAFFKGLLFLGSGSVIHGMHEEQDVRMMGGLRNKMKITYVTFLAGSLAISGIPPLSGFFSKDEILFRVFENAGIFPYIIVLITAVLTAFYMFRLMGLTFYGQPRYDEKHIHPHESPATMTIPLVVLAFLSVVGGLIGLPHIIGHNYFEEWLLPVFSNANKVTASLSIHPEPSAILEWSLMGLSVLLAVIAIIISMKKYSNRHKFEEEHGLGKIMENKYYVDEIYENSIVKPVYNISDKFLWGIIDVKVIDGVINSIAAVTSKMSFDWKKIQTGVIQDYASITIAGIVLIILYFLFV